MPERYRAYAITAKISGETHEFFVAAASIEDALQFVRDSTLVSPVFEAIESRPINVVTEDSVF